MALQVPPKKKRLGRTCNGGGVSVYIKDSVRFKPIDDVPVDDLEIIHIETTKM